ncbi:glycosyltransferase family 4 protein [Paraburkholderia tropica]|uniref:glycosyltransferase family 4 protein n=1 Tax=Paraburkholderia tropica TaxID=92647 RepID=UPI002AB60E07|nr:glycosyltransferase family 4 protein [Paraburkholderia tropica]
MKLLTLFVRYGDKDYRGAFKRLCEMYRQIDGLDYDALLIDTAMPLDCSVALGSRGRLIGGDNTCREFSGWNTALEQLGARIDDYDLVHVVTSAYENEYNGFYPYINRAMFDYAARNPEVVLAHVDAYPAPARMLGRTFQTWGCSKFLIAHPRRIRALGSFTGELGFDDVFSSDAETPFRADAPLSENYRQYLVDWLTGDGLPHGQWHSVFEMDAANLARFHSKAMSILDEHGLSMRLRESGARIVDYTWLHSRELRADASNIPDELTQVRERNRFLFNNPIVEAGVDLRDHRRANSFDRMFESAGGKPFSRTPIIDGLWLGNRQLQSYLDPARPLHCAAIYLNQGIAIDTQQTAWLAQDDNELPQDAILPISRGLHATWLARDDLRASFDMETPEGRRDALRWWIEAGSHDARYAAFVSLDACRETDLAITQDQPLPITRGMRALVDARHDLRESIDLGTAAGRRTLLAWWMHDGMRNPHVSRFLPAACYATTSDQVAQDVALPITCGLLAIHAVRSDLAAFDLSKREGRVGLIAWWMAAGCFDPAFGGFMPMQAYGEIDPHVTQDLPLPITRGLHALQTARPDFATLDLSKREYRRILLQWWLRVGRHDPVFAALMPLAIYSEVDPDVIQDVSVPITRGLHALHNVRDDLAVLDLSTVEGREGLMKWWMREGRLDPVRAVFMPHGVYEHEDASVSQDASLQITTGMRAWHLTRDDLRAAMDLATREGRCEFVRWWMRETLSNANLAKLTNPAVFVEAAPGIEQDGVLPITRGLVALHDAREDLRERLNLSEAAGRVQLLDWWLGSGIDEAKAVRLMPADAYRAIDPTFVQDAGIPVTRAMCGLFAARSGERLKEGAGQDADARYAVALWWSREFIAGRLPEDFAPTLEMLGLEGAIDDTVHPLARALHEKRDDLQDAFDIETQEGRVALNAWLRKYGFKEIGLQIAPPVDPEPTAPVAWQGTWRTGGANILGFGRGELGIGEDVRMASRALQQVDYDFCLPHVPLAIGARQRDMSFHLFETKSPVYRTNLLFLPHYETVRLLAATRNAMLGGRYNIACWQWELPKYPKGMEFAEEFIDEVWSSTSYTAQAMRGATDKPVCVMPMAVDLPPLSRAYRRAEFGMPEDAFVFLNVLDGNSSIARKNPLAVVKAFQKAFPSPMSGVHLLVKTMNMTGQSAEWDEVARIAASDPRISILSGALPREEVIALQSLADCFVSLHRAEGFGRNVAEAMWLGKPAIVSAFSGNMDFTNENTAFMVGGTTVPVRGGEYSFAEGQYWFDADVDEAAQLMRECVESSARREALALAGQTFVRERYSPANVGRLYLERLRQLDQSL